MSSSMTLNDYIFQVRSRTEDAERLFSGELRALQSSQAARGLLKSGATIKLTLYKLEERFGVLTEEIIVYLGKARERTTLDAGELLSTTASLLSQSLLAFKAAVEREKLERLAPGKGISREIDEVFARVDQRLTLRLQDFRFGLHDAAPQPRRDQIPAADRYVTIADNQRDQFAADLGSLKEAVRGSNESSEEDKERALYEIAVFEASIISPVAATDLIQRFVDRVLGWMTTVFTAAVVAEVAERLVKALLPLIG